MLLLFYVNSTRAKSIAYTHIAFRRRTHRRKNGMASERTRHPTKTGVGSPVHAIDMRRYETELVSVSCRPTELYCAPRYLSTRAVQSHRKYVGSVTHLRLLFSFLFLARRYGSSARHTHSVFSQLPWSHTILLTT